MLGGALVGLLYVQIMYNAVGEAPNVCPTFSISRHVYVRKGSLFVHNWHVHHWMVSLCLLPFAAHHPNIVAFLSILVLHGLSYSDAFT